MRVQVLTNFKDGHDQFFAGELRELDNERATKLAGYGWVAVDGVTPAEPASAVTLDIHSAKLGVINKGV